jgi:hypothetical protein
MARPSRTVTAARQLCLLALALACNFDSTGFGEPPPASAGDTTTTAAASTGSASSTTDPTTGGATTSTTDLSTSSATTFPLTSTDPSTSSSSTSLGPDDGTGLPDTTGDDTTTTTTTSSTGPASCADVPYKQIVTVAESTTVAPMIKTMSQQGEGMVAFSEVAEEGTVTFPIDVPCDGQLVVWGRVRDAKPGTGGDDPDSFYTRADAGPESSWFYGCQTGGENSTYRWKRIRSGVQGEPCDTNTVWPVSVTAGAHTITLRNREAKSQGGATAVIARILVTSDPGATPDPGD